MNITEAIRKAERLSNELMIERSEMLAIMLNAFIQKIRFAIENNEQTITY